MLRLVHSLTFLGTAAAAVAVVAQVTQNHESSGASNEFFVNGSETSTSPVGIGTGIGTRVCGQMPAIGDFFGMDRRLT